MRLFLAIELEDHVREALERAVAPLRALEPSLGWSAPGRRHLTLRFLGEQDAAGAARIAAAMDRAAARSAPFEMRLAGLGAFPSLRRARVIWSGVERGPKLELLHHDLELALQGEGFELEARPFRPHVTVARVRTPLPAERARPLARAVRGVHFSAAQMVPEMILFQSTLASSGARYRREHAATLGGR